MKTRIFLIQTNEDTLKINDFIDYIEEKDYDDYDIETDYEEGYPGILVTINYDYHER